MSNKLEKDKKSVMSREANIEQIGFAASVTTAAGSGTILISTSALPYVLGGLALLTVISVAVLAIGYAIEESCEDTEDTFW